MGDDHGRTSGGRRSRPSWRRLRRRYGFAAVTLATALAVGLLIGRMA